MNNFIVDTFRGKEMKVKTTGKQGSYFFEDKQKGNSLHANIIYLSALENTNHTFLLFVLKMNQ